MENETNSNIEQTITVQGSTSKASAMREACAAYLAEQHLGNVMNLFAQRVDITEAQFKHMKALALDCGVPTKQLAAVYVKNNKTQIVKMAKALVQD